MTQPTPEWLAQLRETRPETTEPEAFLMERLIGAMGMVRRLMKHGSYMVGERDAFDLLDDFCMERYGWKLFWRDTAPNSKGKRPVAAMHKGNRAHSGSEETPATK